MTKEIYIFHTVVVLLLSAILESCKGVPITNAVRNGLTRSRPSLINMGVDFNDEPVLAFMKNALANTTLLDDSVTKEYTKASGSPRLRKAIASLYSKLLHRELNPETEILVTAGGKAGTLSAIRALTESVGEEWILIEPFYDVFKRQIELINAVPRFDSLKPTKTHGDISSADWYLDHLELQSLVNSKTRGILFNNPNNPTGKSYNRADLEFIADLAKRHNLFIVSDEVHEFTTDSIIRIATIPGIFERTLTLGSASKAFGVPGWKAGWTYGPAELIERVRRVQKLGILSAAGPIQNALSVIFEHEVEDFGLPQSFLAQNLAGVKRHRDFIVQAFRDGAMVPIVPEGGYCMLAGWPAFLKKSLGGEKADFSAWMSRNIGVLGYNAGNYYSPEHRHLGDNQLRFCYHKSNETLQLAAEKLLQLNKF